MKKLLSHIAVLTAFAAVAVSCKRDANPEEKIPVASVTITPETGSVVAGLTLTLRAEVLPENATDKTVLWGSRNEEYATVDQSGVITGVAVGEATIWAKCGNVTSYATIAVTAAPIRVETVTLNKTTMPLFMGKTEKLTYSIDPANATDQTAAWTSDNDAVATVAENGTVTAVAEGTANITLTIDGKTATCKVTVSIAEMESISTPYLSELAGSTVQMTAEGFRPGDKVILEDFFGYSGSADVENVTAAGATFDLPDDAPTDRTLKITITRDGKAVCIDYIRYDSETVRMAASLGYALTASGEVVTDGSVAGIHGSLVRQGYVTPVSVFSYNETGGTFDAAAADLKLCTFTPHEGSVDLQYVTGAADLSGMKYFDLSGVTVLNLSNTLIGELDMTMFPECTRLLAWGDAGMGDGRFNKVDFGTYGTDAVCKLEHVQLERNRIAGNVDLRNCLYLKYLNINDNLVSGLNPGKANVDRALAVYELNAKNNKLVELDIANCGQLRKLRLDGNRMERMNILNNTKDSSPTGDAMQQYVYIFKSPDCLSIDWATAGEAAGERVINVENYWWRVFSGGNQSENTSNNFSDFEGGWVNGNPVVKALADGFKVVCWTYNGENDGTGTAGDSHAIPGHTHEGGAPCNAL